MFHKQLLALIILFGCVLALPTPTTGGISKSLIKDKIVSESDASVITAAKRASGDEAKNLIVVESEAGVVAAAKRNTKEEVKNRIIADSEAGVVGAA